MKKKKDSLKRGIEFTIVCTLLTSAFIMSSIKEKDSRVFEQIHENSAFKENVVYKEFDEKTLNDSSKWTFSFDGVDAKKLILSDTSDTLPWEYSLDGGVTWTLSTGPQTELTDVELASLSADKDIMTRFLSSKETYTIDIITSVVSGITKDEENNTLLGITDEYEWRKENSDEWTSFKTIYPNLEGNTTVQIRKRATKTSLSSEISTFDFTDDKPQDNPPILEKEEADKEDLIEVNSISSKKIAPAVKIEYDITKPTNDKVVAKITSNEDITVTNNKGSNIYTFYQNSSFTFEYVDKAGNKGAITAKVDWIDKKIPVAIVVYSEMRKTANPVTATLKNETEPIKILNNNGHNTYTFQENGTFEFKYSDAAGNINTTVAKVDWIQKPDPCELPPVTTTKKPATTKKTTKKAVVKTTKKTTKKATTKTTKKQTTTTTAKKNTSTTKKPAEDTEEKGDKTPLNENYIHLKDDNVTLEIPKITVKGEATLKKNNLVLTKNLTAKTGKESEYFELYINTDKGTQSSVSTAMSLQIELDSDKMFKTLYRIVEENDSLEKIDHQKIDTNKIEAQIDHLGKFVVAYENRENKQKKDGNNIIWILISSLIVAILGLIIYKKTKSDDKKISQ